MQCHIEGVDCRHPSHQSTRLPVASIRRSGAARSAASRGWGHGDEAMAVQHAMHEDEVLAGRVATLPCVLASTALCTPSG